MFHFKTFKAAAQKVKKASEKAKIRALNRALSSGSAQMRKALRQETGLTNRQLKKRIFEKKARTSTAVLSIATKVGIHLGEFKPKVKKVRVPGVVIRGSKPKPRTYYGVTVKIGKQSRELVPGGWLWTSNRSLKDMVLARKKAFDYATGRYIPRHASATSDRRPTTALKSDIVYKVAKANAPAVEKHMRESLEKNLAHELKYYMSRK